MIYFCADDYGLNSIISARIQQCADSGAINKVSVFPNFGSLDLQKLQHTRISLHLNLVEGKCMANADRIGFLTEKDGRFRHTFGGLLKESLLHRKAFEEQVYQEIREQILFYKSALPPGTPFCVDSHQHTHMIPGVFRALIRVLHDENINVAYMRIPAEPLMPYITTPSLYITYRAVNLIKQWLLNVLWIIDRRMLKDRTVPTADFLGILFSGEMDAARVNKILPKYIKRANKTGRDIEVLFHPGYLEKNETEFRQENVVFQRFYLSENRKIEFDSVMSMLERSVL